jgi:Tfp pilus assembly protein PilX
MLTSGTGLARPEGVMTPGPIQDERGIALPMAMIVMAILTSLMIAFAVLVTSESQIAGNQMASAQARALAESGVERALWALTTGESNPGASGVLLLDASYNLVPSSVSPLYNGSTFVAVNDPVQASPIGGFKVTVADGSAINEKVVTAVGYVPDATNPIAIKKITTVVTRLKWISPICALCAGGENPPDTTTNVQISGNATINADTGQTCPGVTPRAAVSSNGTAATGGSATLIPPLGYHQSPSPCPDGANCNVTFPSTMTLTDSDMATLKALAKASGPGHYFNNGDQNWTSPPLNGLIFVDTPSGNPLTVNSPDSDKIEVQISGNWQSTIWSGWLVVAGSVRIDGNVTMKGLIYAQNDATLHATGTGAIEGAVISTNRVDSMSTTVDSVDIGNSPINYNCPFVRSGGGNLSQGWLVKPGSYRETAGS